MGKSSNLKKLKSLVLRTIKNLPPCITEYPTGKRLLGSELLKQGTTEVEGKPINPEHWYRQTNTIVKYISHYKKCLAYVKEMGEAGIPAYLMWLAGHRAKMKAKYPHFDPDPAKVEATKTKMTADPRLELLGETISYEEDIDSITGFPRKSGGGMYDDPEIATQISKLATANFKDRNSLLELQDQLDEAWKPERLDEAEARQQKMQSLFKRSRVNLMDHKQEVSNPNVNSIPEDDETL